MNTTWRFILVALIMAAIQTTSAQTSGPAGPSRKNIVDLETGTGKTADHGVALYRYHTRGNSSIEVRKLNLPRRDEETIPQAVRDTLLGMRVGGKRSVTILGHANAAFGMPFSRWNTNFMLELLDVADNEGELKPRSDFEVAAQSADTGKFFAGCEVIQKTDKTAGDQIRGNCLGHRFSNDGLPIPTPCVVNYKASAKLWNVYNCNMDGQLLGVAYFMESTQQLADLAEMGSGGPTAATTNELQVTPGSSANNSVNLQIRNLPNDASRPGYAEDRRQCEEFTKRELSPRALLSLGGFGPTNYVFNNCMSEKYRVANNNFVRPQKEKLQQNARADAQRAEAEAARAAAAIRAKASANYSALVAGARARSKSDPVVLGIILGERWHGVQDVNDCRVANWQANTAIPFCLYEDDDFKIPPAKRWDTCVRMAETKFDTSWIISSQGAPQQDIEGLGAALVALSLASDQQRKCFVDVDVLADGTVGRVSATTSLRGRDVETLFGQLKSKYGSNFSRQKQHWTDGRDTWILKWKLPGMTVVYTEQAETQGGVAFEGGRLEISTSAWDATIAQEIQKSAKPAL